MHLICASAWQATGLCDAQAIPADAVERATLAHLKDFGADVEAWLRERLAEQSVQRGTLEGDVARLRTEKAKVGRRAESLQGRLDTALDGGDEGLTTALLHQLARCEAELAALQRTIADSEAKVAEWTAKPDVEAALSRYRHIGEAIGAELAKADGVEAMNCVLRSVLGVATWFTTSTKAWPCTSSCAATTKPIRRWV